MNNSSPSPEVQESILVVDDVPENLRLLTDLLHQQGYPVHVAPTGKLALRWLQTHLPALILLDIRLPEMDGYEVCRRLKSDARLRDTPVLFISALDKPFDKIRAFEIGGVDYITKPFQTEEVLARVKTHLTLYRMQQSQEECRQRLEKRVQERTAELERYRQHLEERVAKRTAELAQANSELRSAKALAEQASQAKSLFLANMSHELRTPLNAILGFARLMERDGEVSASQRENLRIINRSGEHLLAMINDVLDFSKIEAGKTVLETEICDLHQCLDDIGIMMYGRAYAKGLRFEIRPAANLVQFVQIDSGKLRQVLLNLLDNAIKYTATGYITLSVHSVAADADTYRLYFEVKDSGRGIAAQELARIFDAFTQTQTRPPGKTEGTGLGLAISRHYVRLMGGDIRVESETGHGSVFRFDLPVPAGKAVAVRDPARSAQIVALAAGEPAYRVLVAEACEDNRLLLSKLLQTVGFDVYTALNGKQALKVFDSRQPHLVWLDMGLPVIDSFQVAKHIKARKADVPVIALSASALQQDQSRSLAAGCDDFVRKPFRDSRILEMMARHLGVRYQYSAPDTVDSSDDTLTPAMLATLSADIRLQLAQAAEALNMTAIETLIRRIEATDSRLAALLHKATRDFEYSHLLTCLAAVGMVVVE